jgi:hypothetical protein
LESRLRAKNRISAGAGAVGLWPTVFHYMAEEMEILNHRYRSDLT